MKTPSFLSKVLLMSVTLACQSGSGQTLSGPAGANRNPSTAATVKEWYSAWVNKDWNLLQRVLADGFTFSSPLDDHISLRRVKERCWPNAYKMKRYDPEKVVVQGDDVFVITEGWTTAGKWFRNCDYFKVKDGKIRAYECFFGPGINFPNSGK